MSGGRRPLAVAVLARTFAVHRRAPLPLLGLAAVAGGVPTAALVALAILSALGHLPVARASEETFVGTVMAVVWGLSTTVQVGAATAGALRVLRGERFGFGAALATGVTRTPAVLLVGVLTFAAVSAGAAVFVVPGAAALASLAAAVPAVAEGAGPLRAIGRSLDLTRGDRPAVFVAVAGVAFAAAAAAWFPVVRAVDLHPAAPIAALLWLAPFAPMPAVAAAAAYAELRERKEQPADAELARVFG